jgi:hypothetical protein
MNKKLIATLIILAVVTTMCFVLTSCRKKPASCPTFNYCKR